MERWELRQLKEINLLLPRGECKLHLFLPFAEHDKLNENKGDPMDNQFLWLKQRKIPEIRDLIKVFPGLFEDSHVFRLIYIEKKGPCCCSSCFKLPSQWQLIICRFSNSTMHSYIYVVVTGAWSAGAVTRMISMSSMRQPEQSIYIDLVKSLTHPSLPIESPRLTSWRNGRKS